MASQVDICNLALGMCGVNSSIQDLDEGSSESIACKKNYDAALEQALRTYPWPFAKKQAPLELKGTALVTNWGYVYAYPVDCVQVLRLVIPGVRLPDITQAYPYEIANYNQSKVILTDLASAESIYTLRVKNTGLFDGPFVEAFANLLASKITAIMGKPEMQNSLLQAYYATAAEAFSLSMKESCQGPEPDCLLMRARL